MARKIVLVHGALAESASWDRVIHHLLEAAHEVVAAANPLRGRAALDEPAGERPLWRRLPSWF
jgi:pimeloyl-ACP methyl ester carboxylesterase